MFVFRAWRRFVGLTAVAVAVGAVAAGSSAAGRPDTLWASPTGSGTACSAHSPCSLAYAVANASSGATVRATGGTYQTSIVINTPLHLVGVGHAVLDASTSGVTAGIQILASGSSVEGFTVENAYYEGILVGNSSADGSGASISNVTIDHVTVTNNDTGLHDQNPQGECAATAGGPGDCGEGIHLNSATSSVVEHSYIADNAGGILLTDEWGPNSNNTLDHNTILNNTEDCGITLASHDKPGATPPASFGIYDNTVQHNTVDGNGVAGQGGGILMAGGGPNTQVYGNTITHNEASGNGLAGVVIHDHFPGSNLNNNVITHNRLSNNNVGVGGDTDFTPSDPDPTDILVASGPLPNSNYGSPSAITGTTIEHNQLSNAYYGIWTLNVDPATTTIDHNQFSHINTSVKTN